MPAPGDQHNVAANPFAEAKPRISEYTAGEIATLQSRLEKQLGPEYLSARSGPSGQKVHYIAAEKCIALANEVFGFNGWSSSIQNIQVDFVDENPQTLKISLGLSVVIRVTLRDGTYHEDIGYGHIENCKGKAAAFEKAKKEGTTDALKRALRNFGNVLGNCIYDKDYLAKVTKMKVGATRFNEDNLHRHSDFAKKEVVVKKESGGAVDKGRVSAAPSAPQTDSADSLDDDFGDFDMTDFGVTEDGHPDEVILPTSHGVNDKPHAPSSGLNNEQSKSSTNNASGPAKPMQPLARAQGRPGQNIPPPRPQPQTPNQAPQRPGAMNNGRPNPQVHGRPMQAGTGAAQGQVAAAQQASLNARTNTPPPGNTELTGPVGFFSARSVNQLPEDAPPGTASVAPDKAKVFDPHAESPSIRKTPGIDHKSSKPVAKDIKHVPPMKRDEDAPVKGNAATGTGHSLGPTQSMGRPPTGPGHAMNPSLAGTRQIGAPGGGMSPMGNRGQFRPLSVKRPAADANGRTALNEVSTNNSVNAAADSKRQKTG
ncbi:DNA repair and recombination protein rhm52 [Apiospora kogelbergensis]|uniref:RAD52 homolog n=1 Tax=Apiospora kogelbergensis TaxID=1337665 RepID=A0AAW0QSF4_9PEZI